jgi:hypothetical protein
MKLLSALCAAALLAGPAMAAPLPSSQQPICPDNPGHDWLSPYLQGRAGLAAAPCRQRTAAEHAQRAEWQRTLHLQGLKEKADRVCRVTADIKLFNPYGGKWASKGDYIAAVADNGAYERLQWGTDDYAHLAKDCHLGRMAQYAGNSAEANRAFVSANYGGYSPTVGGPVHVRSHKRCNGNKCWGVRAYNRSR